MSSPLVNVLIIDAQRDFTDEPVEGGLADGALGRLPVIGAKGDMPRIANFLTMYGDKINKVYASMDTHTVCHIGHRFWRGVDGSIAPGGTVFEVRDDKIMSVAYPGGPTVMEYHVNVIPQHQAAMDTYAKAYIKAVGERGKAGRNAVNTWNVHCIEGTPGWQIQPTVKATLDSMPGKVEYFIKGQNQLAEMYSIFAAEVPYEELIDSMNSDQQKIVKQYVYNPELGDETTLSDPIPARPLKGEMETYTDHNSYPAPGDSQRNLKTTFNMDLFNRITAGGATIIVCGEALSHCVQFSARDLIGKIVEMGLTNKVILLEGGSSAVDLGPGVLTDMFKASAAKFVEDMKNGIIEKGSVTDVLSLDSSSRLREYTRLRNSANTKNKESAMKRLNLGKMLGYTNIHAGGRRRKTRKSKKANRRRSRKHR